MSEPQEQQQQKTPALKTYRGNCHCGLFVFEAQLPEIDSAAECNCSICYKKGYLWLFPGPDDFNVVKGDLDDLSAYTFGPGVTQHKFCPTCGTPVLGYRPSAPPGKQIGVNAHAIQDINTWDLKLLPFDGRAITPPYEPPVYTGPEPPVSESVSDDTVTSENDTKSTASSSHLYNGSCHCGAVTLAFRSHVPLDNNYPDWVKMCNCSICERLGAVWIYPKSTQVTISGLENCTRYTFGRKSVSKAFCKTCGVCICNMAAELSKEEYEGLTEEFKGWVDVSRNLCVLNLRALNGWDLSALGDKIERMAGGKEFGERYVNP